MTDDDDDNHGGGGDDEMGTGDSEMEGYSWGREEDLKRIKLCYVGTPAL